MLLLLAPLSIVFSLLSERERSGAVSRLEGELEDRLFGDPPGHRSLVLMDEGSLQESWWSTERWDECPATRLSPGWRSELQGYLEHSDLPDDWKSLLVQLCSQADAGGRCGGYHDPVESLHPHLLMYECIADLNDATDPETWEETPMERRMFVRATSLLERFVHGIRFHGAGDSKHLKPWWAADRGLITEARKDPFLEGFDFPIWTDGELVLSMEPWMGACLEKRPEMDEACGVAWDNKDFGEVVRIMLAEARTREEEKGISRPLAEIWIPTDSGSDYLFLQISVYRVPRSCGWIEPGTPIGLRRSITYLAEEISAMPQVVSDPDNCTILTRVWMNALLRSGVDVERISGQYLTSRGPWFHEFLLVTDEEGHEWIFDPTAHQFSEPPGPERYIVEPGNTDDEIGITMAEWRKAESLHLD